MAYFMADVGGDVDQRDECRLSPNIDAAEEDLKKIGVELTQVNFDDPNVDEDLERLVKHYDMNHRDEIRICAATMPDFESKLKIFFEEHLHNDAELRIIKNGVGYFDVRSIDEKWIRIPVRRGDFVFLPAGIYHRFTPDRAEDVTALRLFRNNPQWIAHNRSADAETQPTRAKYLQEIKL